MGKTFYDTDHEIERRCGADIPWIFDVEGESSFRKRESNVLDELTKQQGIVLATGGGIVHSEANRDLLKLRGTIIYLKTLTCILTD